MTRRVLRYEVPVDDQWHRITYEGDIVHINCRDPRTMEFWAVNPVDVHTVHDGMGRLVMELFSTVSQPHTKDFRVFGTGQSVDEGFYAGTALPIFSMGTFVWHLFYKRVPDAELTGILES